MGSSKLQTENQTPIASTSFNCSAYLQLALPVLRGFKLPNTLPQLGWRFFGALDERPALTNDDYAMRCNAVSLR